MLSKEALKEIKARAEEVACGPFHDIPGRLLYVHKRNAACQSIPALLAHIRELEAENAALRDSDAHKGRALEWTTETPTVPGWYFFKCGNDGNEHVEYVSEAKIELCKNVLCFDAEFEFCAGPIDLPKEPTS